MRPAVVALLALLALPAAAQAPDSTAAAPADSLGPPPPAVPAAPAVDPFGAPPGAVLTPVPATTAALDVEGLLADAPFEPVAVWAYAVAAPGRTAGLSLDGGDPAAPALTLDGRPIDDLVTGAPRVDLLPLGMVGPIRRHAARGRAEGLGAGLRDVRASVPITELRYMGGQDDVQHVSGAHSQTRRPPAMLRGGSDLSRLTVTGHASTRSADDDVTGGDVSHTDAMARALLVQPRAAVEVGVLYADRTAGARRGIVPAAGRPLAAIFDATVSSAVGGSATRRDLRTEGWARVRVPVAPSAPTEAGVSLAAQRLVFVPADGSGDTLRVHGRRFAGFVEQPVGVGGHALALRLEATADGAPGPADSTAALVGAGSRAGLHATVTDAVRLGPLAVELGAGVHRVAGETWPSASARVEVGPLTAGVRYGGRARSWLEAVGIAGRVLPAAETSGERALAADAALDLRRGAWRLGARVFGSVTTDGRFLMSLGDTLAQAVVSSEAVRQGGAEASLGWREAATRGLYARLGGTARAVADPSTDLLARLDAALPRAWGGGRLGVRAVDVGANDVLDLDVAVTARGWAAFRSRRVEPATGALVLPEPGGGLGFELPARATVGLEATATFSARASLFARYDHALGERFYGAVVTQGEPLPPHVLRFGVFWAFLD